MTHSRTVLVYLVCAAALAACAPEATPPATITLGAALPESVQIAAARARDAWCAAPVGWCPELVAEGGEGIIRVAHFKLEASSDPKALKPAWQVENRIDVAPFAQDWTADELSGPMLHEFGHFGIEGHVEDSPLMREKPGNVAQMPRAVDAAAAAEWCAQQGC